MIRRVPGYYKDFTCIASECKDNCCIGGWEIDIDEETVNYYKKVEGEFGDRLRASIGRTDEYCFKLKDGRCPFLDDHNLCEIYGALGEDKMGVVCTQFPRYSEYYGNIKEIGIGLACEEAERIIFSDRNAFTMETEEIEEEAIEDQEYDKELAEYLFLTRDRCFAILELDANIYDKMAFLLDMCYQIQQKVNDNEYVAIQEVLEKYQISAFDKVVANLKKNAQEMCDNSGNADSENCCRMGVESILYAYQGLEVLGEDWPNALDHIFAVLHAEEPNNEESNNKESDSEESNNDESNHEEFYTEQFNSDGYNKIAREFFNSLGERGYEYKNLLSYFVFRYFMKAAYDHDVYEKMQLCVTNFFVIREMDITKWLDNQKKFSFQDRIDTVHIFSREVEYSEDNIESLAEEFLFDDVFKKDNLVNLLLCCEKF